MKHARTLALSFALVLATGCGSPADKPAAEKPAATAPTSAPAAAKAAAPAAKAAAPAAAGVIKADKGVDIASKTVRIGTLNDESGPAAVIGKPYANGKRILAAQINAGGSGILPAGWKIELIEKDHGYNPGKSEQAFKEIKDKVLFVGTSFGTPNTLPLRPFLKQEGIVAYPASLSSQMAEFEHTPPAGPTYAIEAQRALDWAVKSAGGADKVKMGIVYQQDDYGKDGHTGLTKSAAIHKVSIVSEQTVVPGQKDFTAVISALKTAGATHVLLTILPSSTGPLLGTAAKMGFGPKWIGNTPSWIDPFFAHPKLPPVVFANFHWVQSLPFWGEKLPGMDGFLKSYETHGKTLGRPDFYTLVSYLQGLGEMEALKRAIAAQDVSRAGYLKALKGISGWDAGGLFQPLDYTKLPYVVGTKTRILKPDFTKKTWIEVAPYAQPVAAQPAPAAAKPAAGQPG